MIILSGTSADFINSSIIIHLYKNIQQYHQAILLGNTTCVAIVHSYLTQIEAKKHLNAFTEVYAEEALQVAKALDEKIKNGEHMGKLHGVVVAIKDVICYKDHTVTAASKILKDFQSIYNATAVQKLLDEDAIIIGNCNCDEFAMGSTNENSTYGKVLNALDETRVPGGSSGGSAVAVQAGMCMISLGSDTGGSVRQPADFCGIVGLKPTYGRVSRYGLIAYASSFDQIGVFANTIEDAALTLEVIAGADDYDSTVSETIVPTYSSNVKSTNKKYKIAFFEEAVNHPSLDKEIANRTKNLLTDLKNDGHTVESINFDLLDYIVPTYYVLTTAEASSNLGRYDGIRYGHKTKEKTTSLADFYKQNRSEGFGLEVKRRIMLGTFVLSAGYYNAYFSKAQQVRRLLVNKTIEIFKNFDAIILPVSPTTAFKIGEKTTDPIAMYLADIYTVFANLTGIPGIALPLFKHSNGMPYGIQVMTNKFNEEMLFQISEELLCNYKQTNEVAV